jgi:hypothetical protein
LRGFQNGREQQIPVGNDRQKGKNKNKEARTSAKGKNKSKKARTSAQRQEQVQKNKNKSKKARTSAKTEADPSLCSG